jgi:hypothetical protein
MCRDDLPDRGSGGGHSTDLLSLRHIALGAGAVPRVDQADGADQPSHGDRDDQDSMLSLKCLQRPEDACGSILTNVTN